MATVGAGGAVPCISTCELLMLHTYLGKHNFIFLFRKWNAHLCKFLCTNSAYRHISQSTLSPLPSLLYFDSTPSAIITTTVMAILMQWQVKNFQTYTNMRNNTKLINLVLLLPLLLLAGNKNNKRRPYNEKFFGVLRIGKQTLHRTVADSSFM